MTRDEENLQALETTSSAWDQSPLLLTALEGAELRFVAWNELGSHLLSPALSLHTSTIADMPAAASGYAARLREVFETGAPRTARESRVQLPNEAGELEEHYFDYSSSPWRWPDGTMRGVISSAVDVTATVRARQAAQAEATKLATRYERTQEAMTTLQEALLPDSVPVLPGLQLGARYLLTGSETGAGGDWFDVVPLIAGRVALVVGDVVGHGVSATAVMGRLRSVLEERLAAGGSIPDAMRALDAYAPRVSGADAATLCVVLLEPDTGHLEYCTAGHPPPLLLSGEAWRYLPTTGAGPLSSGTGWPTLEADLGPDDLLLLYSDGLVERPQRTTRVSTREIADYATKALAGSTFLAGASTHAADRVCEQTLELVTRVTGLADDITVLAARRTTPVPPLTAAYPAQPEAVGCLAADLQQWLDGVEAGPDDHMALRHALIELTSNVVEHAYSPNESGDVELTAEHTPDGSVVLTVTDHGVWRSPVRASDDGRGALRGLGLPMARQLVDLLDVVGGATGTTVTVRRRLRRPAPLLQDPLSGPRIPAQPDEQRLAIDSDASDGVTRVTVSGPLHLGTVDDLRTRLAIETRGGARPVRVELDGLTALASAGVQLLQQLRNDARNDGGGFTIRASRSSVAHQVLELVALEHETAS